MKNFFQEPVIEIEKFMVADVITASGNDYEPDDNELPGV